MKRSRLFLGVSTALLAVAGVAAAKHYTGSRTAFYITTGGNFCKQVNSIPCTEGGLVACTYTVSSTGYILFTKGPEGQKTGTRCTSQLFYSGTE